MSKALTVQESTSWRKEKNKGNLQITENVSLSPISLEVTNDLFTGTRVTAIYEFAYKAGVTNQEIVEAIKIITDEMIEARGNDRSFNFNIHTDFYFTLNVKIELQKRI